MEIKRKKITAEDIYASEKDLAARVSELTASFAEDFHALGYEIVTELQQKENVEHGDYEELSLTDEKSYPAGYISRALVTIRSEQSEKEAAEETEETPVAEDGEELDAEDLAAEETLRNAEEKLERSVAFTEIMLVRAYKSFWTEWVSICDNMDVARADLDEFLTVLRERAESK